MILKQLKLAFKQIVKQQSLTTGNRCMVKRKKSDFNSDLFDVFVVFIIKRAPTIFILINMTLMIWLVQTIYSSRSDKVPRSIYFFSPYFEALPIMDLYTTNSQTCKESYQKSIIRTFPTIKQTFLKKQNFTKWQNEGLQFCIKKSRKPSNFSLQCKSDQTSCSGYCVSDINQCPITSIKKIRLKDEKPKGFQFMTQYNNSTKSPIYVISRQSKNQYIVGIYTQFQNRCANDFKYFDKYQNFQQYWNETLNCGDEGRVPSQIFKPFDQMYVDDFIFANNLWFQSLNKYSNNQITLGTVNLIRFSNKSLQCGIVQNMAKQLKNSLVQDAVKPTFTQSMLIIAFVFFTVSWGWLVSYYCFEGSRKQKNMIVILMCIIQLIVICFLYANNLQMFRAEQLIGNIASCIQDQIPATMNWKSWRTNSSPFLSIMYCCTCFLLLQIICNFIDRKVYVPYYLAQQGNGPLPLNNQTNNQNRQQRSSCCPCL